MAANKTVPTQASVDDFLDALADERRREEARTVASMMARVTGADPVLWGPSIIGFGRYHYKYDSGREGDFFLTGVAPRKQALTVYIMPGFSEHGTLLDKLGPHRTGRSCLYITRLEKIDMAVLEDMVVRSVAWMRDSYETE